jgi:hypothetical protein
VLFVAFLIVLLDIFFFFWGEAGCLFNVHLAGFLPFLKIADYL